MRSRPWPRAARPASSVNPGGDWTVLTAEGCAVRRERLRGAVPAGCNFVLVGSPEHLIYLADFAPSPFVFRTAEWGALLLIEPGRATLIADDTLGPFAEAAHVEERFTPAWYVGDRAAPERRGPRGRSVRGAS